MLYLLLQQVALKPRDAKAFAVTVEDMDVADDYYLDVIRPLDLGTIGVRLERGVYRKIGECVVASCIYSLTPLRPLLTPLTHRECTHHIVQIPLGFEFGVDQRAHVQPAGQRDLQ